MQILQQLVLALSSTSEMSSSRLFADDNAFSSPADSTWGPPVNYSRPPAIVLWHGLGDNYNSSGMLRMAEIINQIMPTVFVHSVYLEEKPLDDEKRSLLGDANIEVDIACKQLAQIPELAEGFGAIGFSQGGLFLRALIERCPNVTVTKLVTFGSPHMGVLELPLCARDDDWICKKRNALLKKQVWNSSVQKSVIPAQYFRDTLQYSNYLEHSNFLCDVNNENPATFSADAKKRFERLEKLVLIKFDQDTTLVPKESAFFQELSSLTGQLVGFENTRFYKQDLMGLQKLHKDNKIDFYSVNDQHMHFLDQFFVEIVGKYFGFGL